MEEVPLISSLSDFEEFTNNEVSAYRIKFWTVHYKLYKQSNLYATDGIMRFIGSPSFSAINESFIQSIEDVFPHFRDSDTVDSLNQMRAIASMTGVYGWFRRSYAVGYLAKLRDVNEAGAFNIKQKDKVIQERRYMFRIGHETIYREATQDEEEEM